jgi:hypothetical protein
LRLKIQQSLFMQKIIVLIFLGALWGACNTGGEQASNPTEARPDAQLPAGFADFYEKFHQDSLYQIAHISWPLSGDTGLTSDSTGAQRVAKTWNPAEWRMHRAIDLGSGEFKQTFMPLGDDIVVEKIRYAAAAFGLERRFARRSDGSWELIYYADMGELR